MKETRRRLFWYDKHMNETLQKFRYPELLIRDYTHWAALIRYNHVTLGSIVLVNKSGATQLGDLQPNEWTEFSAVCHDMEQLLIKTFGAEKFNYFALMMKDPQVHFHLIPRYSKPVEFQGRVYKDVDWPEKSSLINQQVPDQELKAIQQKLIDNPGL